MKPGDWYKRFGAEEDSHDTLETYYHILDVEGDSVSIDEYGFYTHFQRLVKRNRAPRRYKMKSWLEENIKNNVYEVSKENLPFYLNI